MFNKIFSQLIILQVSVVWAVVANRLSYEGPFNIWGSQRHFFHPKLQNDFFKSVDGSYQYKFDTNNVYHQIFRSERRYSDGMVIGFFGYVDPEGVLRITEYVAGSLGYQQWTLLRYPVFNDST